MGPRPHILPTHTRVGHNLKQLMEQLSLPNKQRYPPPKVPTPNILTPPPKSPTIPSPWSDNRNRRLNLTLRRTGPQQGSCQNWVERPSPITLDTPPRTNPPQPLCPLQGGKYLTTTRKPHGGPKAYHQGAGREGTHHTEQR